MGTTDISVLSGDRVARMGEAVLHARAKQIEEKEFGDVGGLVEKLTEVFKWSNSTGIAAPQIRIDRRVIMFGYEPESKEDLGPLCGKPNSAPNTVLINPSFEPIGDEKELGWEGCFSVPGMVGMVPRYSKIVYYGLTPDGSKVKREAEGFHARLVQHEIDHLDGILYPSRIEDFSEFGFKDEVQERLSRSK